MSTVDATDAAAYLAVVAPYGYTMTRPGHYERPDAAAIDLRHCDSSVDCCWHWYPPEVAIERAERESPHYYPYEAREKTGGSPETLLAHLLRVHGPPTVAEKA